MAIDLFPLPVFIFLLFLGIAWALASIEDRAPRAAAFLKILFGGIALLGTTVDSVQKDGTAFTLSTTSVAALAAWTVSDGIRAWRMSRSQKMK